MKNFDKCLKKLEKEYHKKYKDTHGYVRQNVSDLYKETNNVKRAIFCKIKLESKKSCLLRTRRLKKYD